MISLFINRIDDMVVFHPLTMPQLKVIAKIQLAQLEARLADRGYEFSMSDEAYEAISEAGFDPVFGARPLKRVIQHRIENPMAQAILSGRYSEGETIQIIIAGEMTEDIILIEVQREIIIMTAQGEIITIELGEEIVIVEQGTQYHHKTNI